MLSTGAIAVPMTIGLMASPTPSGCAGRENGNDPGADQHPMSWPLADADCETDNAKRFRRELGHMVRRTVTASGNRIGKPHVSILRLLRRDLVLCGIAAFA